MPAWTQPRVAPPIALPALAGTFVIALALPIYLLAGWRITGYGNGAVDVAGPQGQLVGRVFLDQRAEGLVRGGVVLQIDPRPAQAEQGVGHEHALGREPPARRLGPDDRAAR